MLTEINRANLYLLCPWDSKEEPLPVGGVAMMNEVGRFMSDTDVVALTGFADERCMLIVKLSRQECIEVIKKARELFDASLANAAQK